MMRGLLWALRRPRHVGRQERRFRNRWHFVRHGAWPASVFQERVRLAGGEEVDDDFAADRL